MIRVYFTFEITAFIDSCQRNLFAFLWERDRERVKKIVEKNNRGIALSLAILHFWHSWIAEKHRSHWTPFIVWFSVFFRLSRPRAPTTHYPQATDPTYSQTDGSHINKYLIIHKSCANTYTCSLSKFHQFSIVLLIAFPFDNSIISIRYFTHT